MSRRHDHRQIEVLQRVVGQLAHAGQAEDHLRQQRAAGDERAEVETEEAHERDHRRAQHVAQQNAPLGQALGTRRAHEVGVLSLEQARPQHPAVEADVEHREGDPREEQALEPARRRRRERDVAERWQPEEELGMQPALSDEIDHLAEPEDRHRDADQSDDHDQRIDERAAHDGRQEPHGYPEEHPDDGRADHEGERHGRGVGDLRDDLHAAIDERREVAAPEQLLHHDSVLHGHRPVETEVVPDLLERLRIGIASGDARRRVDAGYGEEDREHDHAQREHNDKRRQQSADDERDHSPPACRPNLSRARGSSASRMPSPSTFTQSTVATIASPGAMATQGRV